MKDKYIEDGDVEVTKYDPTLDKNSSINDFIDRYKMIPRITVIVSTAIYIYCIYTNKPFEVIEYTGYIYSVFVLVYVVGIDSLKDILDWYLKVQQLKGGATSPYRYDDSDDYKKPRY